MRFTKSALRRIALMTAVTAAATTMLVTAQAAGRITETGYINLPDGVSLKYTAVYPDDGLTHPTLMEYSGYNPGSVPDQPYIDRYIPKGYAFIGVNIRGTGCSGGTFDFFEPQQGRDGAFVIDNFISTRPWSNGDVGMIGKSYPGITQLFVAEQRPTHLKAIAPGHFYGDIFRDVAFPGGIFNYSFAALWSFIVQPGDGYQSAARAIAGGDSICAANVAQHTATNARYNAFIQAQEHPYDDALTKERSPETMVDQINVPVYTAISWQDEQVGPREAEMLSKLQTPYWAILTNGDHGMYRTQASLARIDEFFDHFLKGADNGFSSTSTNPYPPITYWWESGRGGVRAPGWTTSGQSFPPPATAKRLFLGSGGKLIDSAETAALPDAYVYPAGSQSIANPYYASTSFPSQYVWAKKPAPGTALSYTTDAFNDDTALIGTASVDLSFASSAPDTDLEVTLTEIRPDGQEEYIQKGWLRASHRKEDPAKSTELRPYQTHAKQDSALLVPGQVTPLRVEIFPFGHIIRKGSKVRLWIEAPNAVPELWGMTFLPTAATNFVYHDTITPSSLVLPVVSGVSVPFGYADCGKVIRQPCRAAD